MIKIGPSKFISSDVKQLIEKIPYALPPIMVDVKPRSDALPNNCMQSSAAQVEKFGGSIVFGWRVVEFPGLFLDAEFHSVWKNPEGNLLDVNTKVLGMDEIFFIPDSHNVFQGEVLETISHAISSDPDIQELFDVRHQLHVIQHEAGKHVNLGREIRIYNPEYKSLQAKQQLLIKNIFSRAQPQPRIWLTL